MNKKVILLILDGWGNTQDPSISAPAKAETPFMDAAIKKYAHANLLTHGAHVGLPDGQMGNSEVGHMNLGAGRIVYQDLAKINLAITNDTLKDEKVLQKAFTYAKTNNKNIHLLGLVSDGGVHSHLDHIKGILKAASDQDLENVFVHAFTDGRDVDPKSGIQHIEQLQAYMQKTTGSIASVIGRYFAMDRDTRWERVKKAYDLLCSAQGTPTNNISKSMEKSYQEGVTDEFMEPLVVTKDNAPVATIKKDDVVIFFNFRTDRTRQLTQVLSQYNFEEYGMKKLPLHFVTLTNYDASFKDIEVIYNKENITQTLGEVLEKNNKTQIRIAETEKYPHVTFFFNGGREEAFRGEKRILCPSPKVATYDLKPQMSAYEITDSILPEIKAETADFICLNFANPDMVGHTGDLQAAIKACEVVDACAKKITEAALTHGYTTIIIADHGNSETMCNPDGSPNTAHTINPVPLIVVDPDIKNVKDGVLGDIAPTILHIMGVTQPEQMTQKSLV